MRPLLLLPFLLAACKPAGGSAPAAPASADGATATAPIDLKSSVVRLNSTVQDWSAAQPWEKPADWWKLPNE